MAGARPPADQAPPGHVEVAIAQLGNVANALRESVQSMNAVRSRGARYITFPPGFASGQQTFWQAVTSPCEWVGYSLRETSAAAALTVTVLDADGDAGDIVAILRVGAGAGLYNVSLPGISLTKGLALSCAGGGVPGGAIYVAKS
jgi:hypothetical protein